MRQQTTILLVIFTTFLLSVSPALPERISSLDKTRAQQISEIRREYQRIRSELGTCTKKKATWINPDKSKYWDRTEYTGYFDATGSLVLLKFPGGEDNTWSNNEYYFYNGKLIFIFIETGYGEVKAEEDRFYIRNRTIIQALIKEKDPESTIDLSKIENKPNDSIMKNPGASSKEWLGYVDNYLNQFREALKKNSAQDPSPGH